jgi:hypothetical protein
MPSDKGARFASLDNLSMADPDNPFNVPFTLAQARDPGKLLAKYPLVGGQFNGSGAELTTGSDAVLNEKFYTINVTIGRNNAALASNIRAPFTAALRKAESASSLLLMVREMRDTVLSIDTNVLEVNKTIPMEPLITTLYLVQQPITFQRPDGRVCFTSPVWSPVPIPEKLLSCDLR